MILKIRDANGNVQEITAIRGEDYVLTEADKQEIADKVNEAGDLSNYYTKAETDAAISEAVEDVAIGDIPTKVSELENDSGYVKSINAESSANISARDGVSINTAGIVDISATGGVQIKNVLSPINDTDAANKAYVNTTIESKGYQTESQVLALIQANLPTSAEGVDY